MQCPDSTTWARFLSGSTVPHERTVLESHADNCQHCLSLLHGYASLSNAFTGLTVPARGDGALEPGRTVGHYELREWLGAGGMGVVWRAHDRDSNRDAALKLLRPRADLPVARATEKLFREARAMKRVHHPNVVPVFDMGVEGDRVFIAMELVNGATLRTWLRAQRRTAAEILAVFQQAGAGLAAAHAVGVVHRDFKPENILIDGEGRARVVDFGMALSQTPGALDGGSALTPVPLTDPGALRGTPAYMAPEQHNRQPVDAFADQYSFCATLFEAVYGRRLRAGEHALLPRSPPRKDVSLRVHRAILRGLREDPSTRFESMNALLLALSENTGSLFGRIRTWWQRR